MTERKPNNKETCPGCGTRSRYPEHPFCPRCNRQYEEVTATALAEGKPITSRLVAATKKGQAMLQQLEERLETKEREEKEAQQPFWNQAHRKFQQNLQAQNVLRVNPEIRNMAVGKIFERLWCEDEKNQQLSRQIFGLGKAIASLEKLLEELKIKIKEAPQWPRLVKSA